MKVGSLFSGIGGFDLGFEQAGFESEWQVEIDKDCKRVLSKHWPNVERFDDVSKVSQLSRVDVLCGGFPCQDLSVAGKRKGLAGERSGLWFEFLRIAQVNKPGTIVIENVPGLLSSDESRDFAVILRGLVECGYCLAWRVLDAQFYGVAQRRRRVFIVGSLGNGSCAQILFESEGVSWNPPTRSETRERIAATIKGGTRGNGTKNGAEDAMNLVCGSVSSKWAKGSGGPAGDEAYNLVTHALRSEGADGTGRGTPLVVAGHDTGQGWWNESEIAGTLRSEGENRPSRPSNIVAFSSKDHGADAGAISPTLRSQNFKDSHIRGRNFESSEELAYALTNPGSGGRPHSKSIAGGFGVRRLTPRECERLQGFPDDFTRWDADGKEISDSARYRMLGNAVAVNVVRWIGYRIVRAESEPDNQIETDALINPMVAEKEKDLDLI